MTKAAKKKASRPRASKYDEKVTFGGTFEEMVNMSVNDANKRMEQKRKPISGQIKLLLNRAKVEYSCELIPVNNKEFTGYEVFIFAPPRDPNMDGELFRNLLRKEGENWRFTAREHQPIEILEFEEELSEIINSIPE